tara:strand:- start:10190 stop:10654 length:465 start_codon:yes stop_codon:yes gene_type:complete
MVTGKDKMKMSYAIRCMMIRENSYQQRYKVCSSTYERIFKETKKHISKHVSGDLNPFFGKKHSEESRRVMKEKRAYQEPPMLGKSHSSITKDKIREANRRQFEDPRQIELRRTNCNKIQGMKAYNNGVINKYFVENTQPEDWIKGRISKKRGSV